MEEEGRREANQWSEDATSLKENVYRARVESGSGSQ